MHKLLDLCSRLDHRYSVRGRVIRMKHSACMQGGFGCGVRGGRAHEGSRASGRGMGPGYTRGGPGSPITVLDAFVRHDRSLQDQHAMRRFVNAALEYITQDPGYVLRALGDPSTPGLERLREICRSDFTVNVRPLL